jgi:hypothetical protein
VKASGLFTNRAAICFALRYRAGNCISDLRHNSGEGSKEADRKNKELPRVYPLCIYDKQIQLKKMGAGVLLKDHLTVSQWYLFKALMAGIIGLIAFFISAGVLKSDMAKPISIGSRHYRMVFLGSFLKT